MYNINSKISNYYNYNTNIFYKFPDNFDNKNQINNLQQSGEKNNNFSFKLIEKTSNISKNIFSKKDSPQPETPEKKKKDMMDIDEPRTPEGNIIKKNFYKTDELPNYFFNIKFDSPNGKNIVQEENPFNYLFPKTPQKKPYKNYIIPPNNDNIPPESPKNTRQIINNDIPQNINRILFP